MAIAICTTASSTGEPPWPVVSPTTTARKTVTNGVAMPSFSPLSMLSARRIRTGTALSVTTAIPSAASVGASTAAMRAASAQVSPGNTSIATTAPSTRVRSSPTLSSRAGHARVTLEAAQGHGCGIGEQQCPERQLGEGQDDVTSALHLEQVRSLGPDGQARCHEHHGGADPPSVEAPREGAVADGHQQQDQPAHFDLPDDRLLNADRRSGIIARLAAEGMGLWSQTISVVGPTS